ncbi:CDP-alcohol phosphatidyltransferase family protein [Clostridium sp. HMP27]|uniref:CDP-alcohol phosphatidyltransferase family protein n=1 Tax=Clostridium sp. HMP27 TaxID=1487921 RepID=UPI00052E0A90|nr:CDP-alcohol phosphatidyltransferase family protein [Clostridium sp. HMP27]KGK86061.1 CDP-alcohol phosphatidyltransferase [Clostridium sp. HMP27]
MTNIGFKRKDKTMHIAESFYTYRLVNPLLPYISKTGITPNMITIFNMIFSIFIFYMAYKSNNIVVGISIQIYLFLDILDGNLARYRNLKSSIGAKLDYFSDLIFYNLVFVFIGINKVQWWYILSVIIVINLYGIIATYYIVPGLRKLKVIKRNSIKKYFMDRGYIIGMDLGTIDIISTILIMLNKIKFLFIILILGIIFDIFCRIVELKYNERLKENN